MANIAIFRINYKSDFIMTLNSDAGWMTPFCIKFWTGAPSQAYFVGFDGTTYTHCAPVSGEPTKLRVQFDDHHLPVGDLKFQIAYHFTVADFPNDTEDEVINPANITTEIDGQVYQVMLDFTGETAPEIQFSLPAYANEAARIENELQRQENELARQEAELQREQASAAAVQGAENVNAQLNGAILTVTNRNGVSTSKNVQGPQGIQGPQGETGATPVIEATASVDDNVGIPMVTVDSFGPAESRTFDFAFKNLKGEQGAQGPEGPQGIQGPQGEPGNYTKPASGIPMSDLNGNVASGIVYDVTANNSGATFASLSALLSSGSLSTLIPTDVRKGGMQIRFVLSSDNKYVQYRLTADEFSTDVDDWERAASVENLENGAVIPLVAEELDEGSVTAKVIAEAMLYLYNENKALREMLTDKDVAVLPYIKAQNVECDDILTLGVPNVLYSSVAGAPSAANIPDNWDEATMDVWFGCPRKIGQQYVDKVSKMVYYAVAVTGSTSDWVVLN